MMNKLYAVKPKLHENLAGLDKFAMILIKFSKPFVTEFQ